ncbi:hypothetical protein [Haloferula sp. A504]|uniref:hypothetical protein n=1 Tax=Haloferula sp. A504 TaxID=3373601 RepID=UPI0031C5BA6B|nr:hypothetical protein [Verrucomicrobiaceae bacterium E54]
MTLRRTLLALALLLPTGHAPAATPDEPETIKAYCLDFNWVPTNRRGKPFAKPGQWAGADPAAHVEWYKTIGANVIQTFCVSTNGYAWYKDGFVPEQPGLKHDFLPEVVKLGHAEGMQVFGYFCIASNPRWAELHPEQSYGSPTTYHIPYTDEYLDFLSKSIGDAVKRTGIDGFMIDWVWMPKRQSTEGKWLDCEKKLYQQLMGEPFPGEDKLTPAQDTAYSRKAIDRCWKAIRKAAKDANPDCKIWLTVNHINHPHVVNSDMYREADWLMNEAGSVEAIRKVEPMVGEDTRMITCMALWNGQDASVAVPEAMEAGIGLYGFTAPRNNDGLVPLDKIFSRQVFELSGDDRNIAVLARAYHGMSVHALWQDGRFVEPENPPPFRISLKGRGRGMQDTARIDSAADEASVTIRSPYSKGRGVLVRGAAKWPSKLSIRFHKKEGEAVTSTQFRIANGSVGLGVTLDDPAIVTSGPVEGGLDLGRGWDADFLKDAEAPKDSPSIQQTTEILEIVIPAAMTRGNPEVIAFEWE